MKHALYALVIIFFTMSNHALASKSNSIAAKQINHPGKININTANAKVLTHSIRGIGPKRAEAVVHYRQTHGLFKRVEDISKVRGIGKKFVKRHSKEIHQLFSVD